MSDAAKALARLANAADCYAASQVAATDARCGIVQPVTVAEAEELNAALTNAWAVLEEEEAPSKNMASRKKT